MIEIHALVLFPWHHFPNANVLALVAQIPFMSWYRYDFLCIMSKSAECISKSLIDDLNMMGKK
jgi:hypothetical protein